MPDNETVKAVVQKTKILGHNHDDRSDHNVNLFIVWLGNIKERGDS